MQQVQPSPLPARAYPQRTARVAWLVLFAFFTLFCLLLAGAISLAWRYYATATDVRSAMLIVRGPAEWIAWQQAGRSFFQRADGDQLLGEGDEVRIATSAGYGQVATVRLFEQSTLDLWANANVRLDRLRTSRWNRRSFEVALRQYHGYVRYDLRAGQPYEAISFRIELANASVVLMPGGSYSIGAVSSQRNLLPIQGITASPIRFDIAVRSGSAIVQGTSRTVKLLAGQRLVVDEIGEPGPTLPARWELIDDGSFSAHSEREYNNTTVVDQPALARSQTWQVYGVPADAGATGIFRLSRICQPPASATECDPHDKRRAAWLYRSGGQTRSFTTGIFQDLGTNDQGVDISEYRSLVFSVWGRVLAQSLELTGDQGTECPLMFRLLGKKNHPTDPEQERVICLYSSSDPEAMPERWPGVHYIRVKPFEWRHVSIELRDPTWLPDFRYLRRIEIYANGHDYNTQLTNVSLIGSQFAPEEIVPRIVPESGRALDGMSSR